MTYFYAEKFFLINIPPIPITFYSSKTNLTYSLSPPLACDVNLVISMAHAYPSPIRQLFSENHPTPTHIHPDAN